jgi:hypothetical protein
VGTTWGGIASIGVGICRYLTEGRSEGVNYPQGWRPGWRKQSSRRTTPRVRSRHAVHLAHKRSLKLIVKVDAHRSGPGALAQQGPDICVPLVP